MWRSARSLPFPYQLEQSQETAGLLVAGEARDQGMLELHRGPPCGQLPNRRTNALWAATQPDPATGFARQPRRGRVESPPDDPDRSRRQQILEHFAGQHTVSRIVPVEQDECAGVALHPEGIRARDGSMKLQSLVEPGPPRGR